MEYVQVLFVGNMFFTYDFGTPLVSVDSKYIFECKMQNSVGRTSAVSDLDLASAQKLVDK